ncbi:MAG: DUF342 domain-containing protein, partial [Fibrobacter sp.]|nr:DUF342 domain-containing protein [Fibrobacter sp.]
MAVRNAKLYVAPDEMSAYLSRIEMATAACQSAADVQAELEKQKIIFGVDLDGVEEWLESDDEEDFVVARGDYAKNGRNAYVKFHVSFSAKPEFVPDSEEGGGTVDFKTAMRVPIVEKGDLLAEYIPPTKGEPGTNIFGGTIAASAGDPINVNVGDGVEQDVHKYISKSSGTPSYKDSVISVKTIFEVDEVSYASGNINFPGTVIVRGDVLEGFEVKANEHVIIQGVVNAAKVSAGGYIQCLGGVLGKGKTELSAGEFIEVRHADSAALLADGDITVTKDMLHCKAYSLGSINCGGVI